MKNRIDTVAKLTNYIQKNLTGFYPDGEINQLVFLILNHLLIYSKIDIHLNAGKSIPQNIYQQATEIVTQLTDYKPIQYILGKTEFYGLHLKINNNVLIPRQETEELVHWVVNDNTGNNIRILDIGTGSGCIAIALATGISNSLVDAIDISEPAIQLARENALMNGVAINFFKSNILDDSLYPCRGKYEIIVSNPPYVRNSEKKIMSRNVLDFEPHLALFVNDDDPLIFYKSIAKFGLNNLNKDGKIYLEVNENLGAEVKKMFLDYGYPSAEVRKDMHGKDRMVKISFVT